MSTTSATWRPWSRRVASGVTEKKESDMSAAFWAIVGVGVALAGLQWRMYTSLSASLNGRMDRIEVRLDRIEADLTSIKGTPVAHRRLDCRALS